MSYQKKYYFTFVKLRTTEVHTIELWQNTGATLTAEEVTGGMDPFIVEMPELDHKFQTVRGSGCTINLLSKTDGQFFTGLYHVDPQEFMVKHYIGGSLNWIGYLNAEMTDEPYDVNFNYPFTITGNDGFALMDRFSFVQADSTAYTGIKSKFEILQICLNKIALPYNEIRIALATTGPSFGVNESILHASYINCANFYDEDGKPMSLREVVESILAPYGAYIRLEDTNIQICDIDTLARNSSVTYRRFTQSSGAYAGAIAIPNVKDISVIKYAGTGSRKELSGGVNRQVVSYSPYPVKEALPQTLASLDEFGTVPAVFSTKDGYYYRTLEDCSTWELSSPATFQESYYFDPADSDLYIQFPRQTSNTLMAGIKINNFISVGNPTTDLKVVRGAALLITGEILVKTRDNPYDDGEDQKEIQGVTLTAVVKIGSEYYTYPAGWSTSSGTIQIPANTGKNEIIADKFIPLGQNGQGMLITIGNFLEIFPLGGDTIGNFDLEIYSEYTARTYSDSTFVTNHPDVKEIWLKNIKVEVVNIDGNEIPDKDVESIGLLDKNFQNEGEKITLTCGNQAVFADKGRIMWLDSEGYHPQLSWTRNAQTGPIADLLLVSLCSNYRAGFITLSGLKLKQAFSLQNVITDTSYLSTKKLMVKSATINYHENLIECSLVEISKDDLTIVY